jgi:para-aminobenzoate synthetase component 1
MLDRYLKNISISSKSYSGTFEHFLDLTKSLKDRSYFSTLLSDPNHESSKFSYCGYNPFLSLQVDDDKISIKFESHSEEFTTRKESIVSILDSFDTATKDLADGYILMGNLGYELGGYFEDLTTLERGFDNNLITLLGFTKLFRYSHEKGIISEFTVKKEVIPSSNTQQYFEYNFPERSDSYSSYIEKVEKVRSYIREGEVYQVNLSQRFNLKSMIDSTNLFFDLFENNPAPFFSYLSLEDQCLISTSPERFILIENGDIETRPIKGTIKRGSSEDEDRELKRELLSSKKDEAELAMIVDLMRNDLSRVSYFDSVVVDQFKRIEGYRNVYHLVAIIRSKLLKEIPFSKVIGALFPGGSITGCPKIAAMEKISLLERERRGAYTGSIFGLGRDYFDSSIAIRTIIHRGDTFSFRVGGGIVYDSDPQSEYEETLHKGETLSRYLNIKF